MAPLLVAAAVALALAVLFVRQRREIATLSTRLAEASRFDAVTGLLSQRAFEELLGFELDRSRRTGRPVSVIIGELDGVGRLNAERGHAAGDTALRQVADDMAKWKRRIDSAARLGGDKFGILLPETDEAGAFLVAERLRRASRRTFAQDALPLTISFGIACYPLHGDQFGVLMSAAVRAVHVAADLGRDRSVIYCPDVESMLSGAPDPAASQPRVESLIGLAEELDLRDAGVIGHSHAVGDYAELMARELGFPAEHVERVRLAGVLHDIGKTGVSDRLLTKRGPLEPDEWATIRTHPESGARLLSHPELEDVRAWVLAHHERVDGKGYPNGLAGEDIPVEARILAIADAYEAMTSERPNRTTLADGVAADELRAGVGTQFDPQIVVLFLAALERQRTPALHQAS